MSKSLTTDRANTGSKYLGRLPFVDIFACALFIARGLLFAFIFVREFDKPVGLQLSQERMNAPSPHCSNFATAICGSSAPQSIEQKLNAAYV